MCSYNVFSVGVVSPNPKAKKHELPQCLHTNKGNYICVSNGMKFIIAVCT